MNNEKEGGMNEFRIDPPDPAKFVNASNPPHFQIKVSAVPVPQGWLHIAGVGMFKTRPNWLRRLLMRALFGWTWERP